MFRPVKIAMLGLAMLCGLPTGAQAAPPYQNTTPGGFSNAANPCTGTAFTRTIVVGDSITIVDLDVGVLLSHDWREDTRISLRSPANTTVVLVNDAGGGGGNGDNNYNIRLDDEATVLVDSDGNHALTPTYANENQPNNPLSAFDGQNALGTWTLSLCDSFSADNGTFTSAELFFNTEGGGGGTPGQLGCDASEQIRHDWNNIAWPPGSLVNQFTISGEDFRFSVSGSTGSLLNDPETGNATPDDSTYYTGGQGTTQQALFFLANHPNATNSISMTIDIGDLSGGPNLGVGELQFTVFDVDFGASQFQDTLTVTGTNGTTTVMPTLTAGASNTVIGNVATGTAGSGQDSADGNVVVTFSERVTQVIMTYGNGTNVPTDPGNQGVAVYDMVSCPVKQAVLEGDKSTRTFNDLYALPGNDVIYTITIRNTGNGSTDADSVFLVDQLPPEIEFYRGPTASIPVTFTETGTGLTYTYATDIGYSDAATKPADMSECNYNPSTGYDAAVTYICFNPKGEMAAGDPDPEFSFEFRARIK